jgi:hypothetical protein
LLGRAVIAVALMTVSTKALRDDARFIRFVTELAPPHR